MATTTNYGWDTPDDTDLVKDGAAAIRTLGSSVDTTTKNLNPQTTTGALAYRSATSNVNTALPIGTTGQVLTVAAGVPSWASPAAATPSSAWTFIADVSSSAATFSITLGSYNRYLVFGYFQATSSANVNFKLNNLSATNYNNYIQANRFRDSASNQIQATSTTTGTSFALSPFTSTYDGVTSIEINNANSSAKPVVFYSSLNRSDGSPDYGEPLTANGFYNANINVSSIDFAVNNNTGSYFRAYGLN